jgi:uncharacterized membrane protein
MFHTGKILRTAVCGLTALTLFVVCGLTATAQNKAEEPAKPKKTPRQQFMHSKLVISQEILQGVVLSDYERIKKNATALNILTLAEEWTSNNSTHYVQMSEELRRICKQLANAGRDKDIDAAALAYQRMTLNCVECHQALRDGFK